MIEEIVNAFEDKRYVLGVSLSPIAKRAALSFHLIYLLFSHCFGFCNCCLFVSVFSKL